MHRPQRQPDGSTFAVSPRPDRVSLLNARTRTRSGRAPRPARLRHRSAFSPDGKFIAATGTRNAVIWDTAQRKIIRASRSDSRSEIILLERFRLARTADRGDRALRQHRRSVRLRTGRQTHKLVSYGSILDLDFSSDGKLLATAEEERVHLERRRREHRVGPQRPRPLAVGSVFAERRQARGRRNLFRPSRVQETDPTQSFKTHGRRPV